MEVDKVIEFISRGRTDYIFDLLKQPIMPTRKQFHTY